MTTPQQLREPAHQVSARAPAYWRTAALIGTACRLLFVTGLAVIGLLVPNGWWTWALVAVSILVLPGALWRPIFVPRFRYRHHRWEVTDIAIHVRDGWLVVVDEIVPLSRVQTVDSTQGPLMRRFGLRTVSVSTASNDGTVSITCLDDAVGREVVAKLVAITAATPEDAT